MAFFKSILISALVAGIVAGVGLTGLQTLKVYPLIFAAEAFEDAGSAPGAASASAHDHHAHEGSQGVNGAKDAGHHHDETAWMPADGAERLLFSLLSNVLMGVALGLILASVFALRQVINWRHGVVWGLGGFIALNLAPAVGIPPELPGMPAGDLLAKQTWWLSTALLTAGGIALIFLCNGVVWRVLGVAMIALPQIYGAPHLPSIDSAVPAVLAADFATASLATNLVFWAVLGLLTAEAMARMPRTVHSKAI